MVLGFWDLAVPIVGAPMAGGPGTPALAAAVSNAGGLGFIAGGYVSAEQFAERHRRRARRHHRPDRRQSVCAATQRRRLDRSWTTTRRNSKRSPTTTSVEVGYPQFGDDDDWERKLEVVADVRPEMVSFTFGAPSPDVMRRFGALGLLVLVTVTSAYEAGVAIAAGADGLVVQGPDAGGHRGTFAPDMEPGTESLHRLLDRIGGAHDVPLIAAGGLGTAEDVDGVCAGERWPRRSAPRCCSATKPAPTPHTGRA